MSIDSSGYRNMKLTAGCADSKLEAKGGIIGGYVQLQQLQGYCESCIKSLKKQ